MKKLFGWCGKHKTVILAALLAAVSLSGAFAAGTSSGVAGEMDERVYNIVDFFNNGWVKGVCALALIAECLGLLFAGGQNPQIFKKFLPVIAGTVLFMCAGKITTIIWGTKDSDFSEDLKKTGMVIPCENEKSVWEFDVSWT